MPSTGPRVNAVLERPLCSAVRALGHRHGVSMSEIVRRLVRQALELEEDAALADLVERRAVNPAPSIPHEEVGRRFGGLHR